jgi:hypothetical protein
MNKLNTKLEVVSEKISDKHNDSFWYDGVIAVKGDYRLIACGDIRIVYDNGEEWGTHNGFKAYDSFREIENDDDLEEINNDKNYYFDMNNWFEILDNENESVGDIYGNYDDALEALREMK